MISLSGKIIDVSDSLNYDSSKHAYTSTIQVYKDELYCVWHEKNTNDIIQIKIKKYDGMNWSEISSSLNYYSRSYNPTMEVYKDELYCAWYEDYALVGSSWITQIKVKKYDGVNWINVSSNLNYNSIKTAYNPTMEVYKDELYCTWYEINSNGSNYQIKMKKYDGISWSNVSSCLNYNSSKTAYNPHLETYKNELYCIWREHNGSNYQIMIKKYDGMNWSEISNCLNYDSSKTARYPVIQVYKNELYCVWNETNGSNYQIKVKKYDGNDWSNISSSLNYDSSKDASYTYLQAYKNELYCIWQESNSSNTQIKMRKYNGTNWTNVSDNLNYNSTKNASYPYLEVYKDELYCTWYETNESSINQIKMKRYDGIIEKFLIGQDSNYYSMRFNLYKLGQSDDNIQLEKWYDKHGVEDINILTKNLFSREMPMTLDEETNVWYTDFELDANQVLDNIEMTKNNNVDDYRIIKYDSSQYRILDELKDEFEIMMATERT